MLSVMGGSYLIISELAVQWLPSALNIPMDEDPPKAVYPVWLMDALGVRAAFFVRCPTCKTPMGITPSDLVEQKNWNAEKPNLTNILACSTCAGLWMITADRAYQLQVLPAQSVGARPVSMPPRGGTA